MDQQALSGLTTPLSDTVGEEKLPPREETVILGPLRLARHPCCFDPIEQRSPTRYVRRRARLYLPSSNSFVSSPSGWLLWLLFESRWTSSDFLCVLQARLMPFDMWNPRHVRWRALIGEETHSCEGASRLKRRREILQLCMLL